MRLSVVKQSLFGPLGQYGRLVTRANYAEGETHINFNYALVTGCNLDPKPSRIVGILQSSSGGNTEILH